KTFKEIEKSDKLFSFFSHILDMNPHYVKIDGVFIKNILRSKKSQLIVKAIVDFTHSLGIKVIAEYVHSKEVYDYVKALGIDEFQGYYISKPLEKI
ncbi:MAG: EAL domain-containing protein, partial [Campylobacterales bacterium]|nr:EAL domain-containing protein [Campylobacterales bacterium]